MQRLLAILLLSVIGYLPVSPAFAAPGSAAKLPACCRAHGKHKCAMRSAQPESALYAVCSQCPVSAQLSSPALHVPVFPPVQAALSFDALAIRRIAPEQSAARLSISFDHSRRKRGPPSFLS
jgi:hypothetical protein